MYCKQIHCTIALKIAIHSKIMSYHLLRISHIWKDLSLLIQQKRRVIRYLPTGWIRLQLGYSAKLHHRSGRWLNSNIVKVVILVIWIHYSNQHLQHHDIPLQNQSTQKIFQIGITGQDPAKHKRRRKQFLRWAEKAVSPVSNKSQSSHAWRRYLHRAKFPWKKDH